MAFCKLNGIVVPIDVTGAEDEPKLIEDRSRMEDASLFVDRRAEKSTWRGTIIMQVSSYASAFRKLVHGDGHYFSYDSSLYSSRGLAPSSATGTYTFGSSSPTSWLGGQRLRQTATGVLQYTFGVSGQPWTASFARDVNGAGWNHYIINSLGQKWLNGVRNDGTSTTFFGVTSGVASLTADGSLNTHWDELILYPFAMPTDWPPQLYDFQNPGSGNTQVGALRYVKLSGDIVDDGTTRVVIGQVTSAKIARSKTAGVIAPRRALDIELEEV